jgi:hypothetical protein
MAAPTQLNIVLTTSGNPTVNVSIPAGLANLDSGNTYGQGQVATLNATTGLYSGGQTGFSSIDILIRNIFRAGGFLATNGNWYSTSVIQSIAYQ